eukprot:3458127-Pleurochrysis_carterae.AAC.1
MLTVTCAFRPEIGEIKRCAIPYKLPEATKNMARTKRSLAMRSPKCHRGLGAISLRIPLLKVANSSNRNTNVTGIPKRSMAENAIVRCKSMPITLSKRGVVILTAAIESMTSNVIA